jgi:hypothetical protein
MTLTRKPGNSGWVPGGKPVSGRPPEPPAARHGGSGMPGVRMPTTDPKHPAKTVYQFGSGASSIDSRPALKDPAWVSHSNRRVDEGKRLAPTQPKGKTRGA